mmetsp:Transcript_52548/g.97293  ORF Transcript_52548/g.97293 Transcript_52548/m.97293 type:complete len:182 (+) Transcript_52548:75-620(+)
MPRGALGPLKLVDFEQASILPPQQSSCWRTSGWSTADLDAIPSAAVRPKAMMHSHASFLSGEPRLCTSFSGGGGHSGDEAKAHAMAAFSASSLSLLASMASFLTAYVHFSFDRDDLAEEQKKHAEHLQRVESSPRSRRLQSPTAAAAVASAVQPTTVPETPTNDSGGGGNAEAASTNPQQT